MSAPLADIVIKDGDYVSIPIVITGDDGLPLDLTEATVLGRVWIEGQETDTIAPFSLVIATPPTSGIVHFELSPSQHDDLIPRGPRYWYDVRVVNGKTQLQGRIYKEPSRYR